MFEGNTFTMFLMCSQMFQLYVLQKIPCISSVYICLHVLQCVTWFEWRVECLYGFFVFILIAELCLVR